MPDPGNAAAPGGAGASEQANHVVGDDTGSIPDKGRQTSAYRFPVSLITAERPDRLAKHFHYNGQGELLKEPGGNLLQGYYERQLLVGLTALVGLIEGLAPNQALCFGIAQVENAKIVCQHALEHGAIARTREFFDWPDGSGILMLDYDPRDGKAPLDRNQLLESLFEVCPTLREAPMAVGASGSTFIYDSRTNVQVRGPGGLRIYILVKSAKDIPRAGKVIFERLWLAGCGYVAVSKSGRMLLRTLVDAAVWQPERLDFAAGAACESPLEQRRPPMEVLNDGGDPFDTVAYLSDLNAAQRKQLKALQDEERERCKPDADRAREAWVFRLS